MNAPHNTGHFTRHLNNCNASHSGKMTSFFPAKSVATTCIPTKRITQSDAQRLLTPRSHPCEGLSSQEDLRILEYVLRTGGDTAGGPSLDKVSQSIYQESYSITKNNPTKKARIIFEQGLQHRWRVDDQLERVFSLRCKRRVNISDNDREKISGGLFCSECRLILNMHQFTTAINVPLPDKDKMKHTNKRFTRKRKGIRYLQIKGYANLMTAAEEDKDTKLAIRFAMGVALGKYKEKEVFMGLLDTMVGAQKREDRGKKLHNFMYSPVFDHFVSYIAIKSPQAHQMLQEHFQVRSKRSLR